MAQILSIIVGASAVLFWVFILIGLYLKISVRLKKEIFLIVNVDGHWYITRGGVVIWDHAKLEIDNVIDKSETNRIYTNIHNN